SLHYRYPPPTTAILTNIMNALIAVPKLYIQVLHLMNKMNLPPPFGPITETPPVYVAGGSAVAAAASAPAPSPSPAGRDPLLASDESELESDEDVPAAKRPALPRRRRDTARNPAIVAPPPVVVVAPVAPPPAAATGTKRPRSKAEAQAPRAVAAS